jgi:hypothetical protein
MVALSPTQRPEWLILQPESIDARLRIEDLLKCYEEFLAASDASEEDLIARFLDQKQSRKSFESALRFGGLVFEVLAALGQGNRFHRLLVV